MCLPVQAILTSSEVSGAAFKLYACYCAHREGFEANVKSEQVHAETGIGTAYISTLKFELLKAGWIGLSKQTAKGVVPLKGFEVPLEHIRTERKLSKIERTSDKESSKIERKVEKVSKNESPIPSPDKLSNIERMLSDEVSKNESFQTDSFENQRVSDGTPIAPYKAETTKKNKSQSTIETAEKNPAVVDWSEIGRERDLMLSALKDILGAVPAIGGERAACNWLLKNRTALNATTADFIECLREQAEDVREGNWRRKVSWMIVKSEFPAWQLRARAKHNGNGGSYGKQVPSGRTTYNERANAALAELYDLDPLVRT
jgi:hypothetical protein